MNTAIGQASKTQSSDAADVVQVSPLEAFKSEKEDFSKRDLYSKHYVNEDGSYTALIGAGPIHYEENGQFLDIDHNISRQSDSQFPYANTSNLFESYFGETSHTGVKNKTKEGEITEFLNTKMYWEVNGRMVNETNSSEVAVSIEGDKAYYNNLYGNISAEFIMLTGKRKLNYIIPNRQALSNNPGNAEFLVFTEDVKLPEGWKSTVTKNGVLIQNLADKEIYLYENPVSTDAANALSREENTVFETALNGNILTIMTKVKTEWLLSNDRLFPVKVDPTVDAFPNNARNWTGYVWSDGEYANNDVAAGYPSAPYWVAGSLRFNLSSIPNNSTVTASTGYINITGGFGAGIANRTWALVNSMDPLGVPDGNSSQGSALYNSMTAALSQTTGVTSLGWRSSLFAPAGRTYIQNAINNDFVAMGLYAMGSYTGGQYFEVAGYSSANRPYLRVDYTEPITDRTLTVSEAYDGATYANGDHVFDNNTAVTATSGTRAGYVVTGWTGTGSVPATGNTDSATFTITENSSITWQWQQTGTPKDVVFHNYGGAEQLAFNNSRIATNTPVFRMSHSNYDANAYEVQISSSSTFGGTVYTQEFSGTYAVSNEENFTFNNAFTPSEGTTYYVRARVKGAAGVWSAYSTKTYTFTYNSTQTSPDWYQVTQQQFATDILNGVNTQATGGVVTGAGGNRVVNGDFTSGNTTGWTITKGSNTVDVVNAINSQFPGNWLRMGSPNFGVGGSGSIVVSQEIDLTNVTTLSFSSGNFFNVGSPFDPAPNTKAEFKIGGTLTNTTGTSLSTINQQGSGQGGTYYNHGTKTVDVSSYNGVQVIKFVMTYNSSWNGNGSVYFLFDNIVAEAPPAGTVTSTPIHLASVQDATGYEGITWDQTLNGGNLTLKVQGSADGVNFSDVPGYTNISEAGDGIKTVDLSALETPPAHLRLVGTLDGAGVTLHSWSVGFAGTPEPTYDFVYHNDTEKWTPNYPGDTGNPSDATSTILVMEGTAVFNSDIVAGSLTVNEDAYLEVENILKLHGDIINNGLITFKSGSVPDTAQFDEFNGSISGNGEITVERFIPARRAYRFLSPAVTTSGTIYDNWQEGGDNTPGWGTHITGAEGATNGFDPTGTNNPSMFEVAVDGSNTQYWKSVPNTDQSQLTAGIPYLMMVRGDRTIDLTNNNPTPTETVLRATGALATGDQTFTGPMMDEGQNFFIGNPYQAAVSIADLLAGATNIKPEFYWFYNANMAGNEGRGQYVTVDMDLGGISTPTSEANGFLQPGQAILVHADGGGAPSVTFKESFKRVTEPLTQTFRSGNGRLALQLYYEQAYVTGQTPTDGISIKFSENGNNGIDDYDAPKMNNFDENFATINGENSYSIESRAYPVDGEIIPLSINTFRTTNYVFEARLTNIPEQTAIYLYDHYTGYTIEFSEQAAVLYSFQVDPAIEASISSSRFELRFTASIVGVEDWALSAAALYPNPLNGNSFQISAKGFEGKSLNVQVVNMLGQSVYSGSVTAGSNGVATITLAEDVSSGIYNVKIVSEDNQVINKKLIKN